jgi:uncharacterized membrane protein SirB2
MRKFVYVLYFLAFTTEDTTMFAGNWQTYMAWVDQLLFRNSMVKLPLYFFCLAGCLAVSLQKKAARNGRAAPMDRALWGSLGAITLFILYGAVTGGKPSMAYWQLYIFVTSIMMAKLLMATMTTPAHFVTLGKVILAAALYRAFIGILFWFVFVHNEPWPKGPPPHMTSHSDTVLFVSTIVMLLANAIETRTRKAIWLVLVVTGVLIFMIQINNRRLAYVSLSGALLVLYLLLPKGKVKRKFNIALMALSPIIALYVAVGWGRKEKIFKPLQSFSTMSTNEDSSTLARKAENHGLHETLVKGGFITGTGWGQEYVEFDSSYSIAGIYKEWKYVPHNSVLGILAFSGILGFMGLWMPFPVSLYLNARIRRLSKDPTIRTCALTGIGQVVVCTNQMYGDMGLQSQTTLFMIASAFAFAGRMAVPTGAWAEKKGTPGRANTIPPVAGTPRTSSPDA